MLARLLPLDGPFHREYRREERGGRSQEDASGQPAAQGVSHHRPALALRRGSAESYRQHTADDCYGEPPTVIPLPEGWHRLDCAAALGRGEVGLDGRLLSPLGPR